MATSNKTVKSKTTKTMKTKNAALDQMKYEIASEFGVNLGANATSRENGQVGGEITRRLVNMAKKNAKNTSNE